MALGKDLFSNIFFCMDIGLFQHYLLTFSVKLPWHLHGKSFDHLCLGLFVLLMYTSLFFFYQYHIVLITIALQQILDSGNVSPPTLLLFLKIANAILVHLCLHKYVICFANVVLRSVVFMFIKDIGLQFLVISLSIWYLSNTKLVK